MSIFDKWNNTIDTEGLKKDVAESANGSGDFDEVPVGTYEVKIEKMELKESSKHDPMFVVWFKILQGDQKGRLMFMNQVITKGFQIHIVNEFLKSLDAVDPDAVVFEDYSQYNDLVMDVMEAVSGSLEYLVEFKKSNKGYSVFTIKEVYEV